MSKRRTPRTRPCIHNRDLHLSTCGSWLSVCWTSHHITAPLNIVEILWRLKKKYILKSWLLCLYLLWYTLIHGIPLTFHLINLRWRLLNPPKKKELRKRARNLGRLFACLLVKISVPGGKQFCARNINQGDSGTPVFDRSGRLHYY